MKLTRRPGLLALALAGVVSACDEPLAVDRSAEVGIELPGAVLGGRLDCRVTVASGDVRCAPPTSSLPPSASADVIIGGQGQYVFLSNDVPIIDGSAFRFNVTVMNLIPQALGTLDGTTAHAAGVRVFFSTPPFVTVGTGTATVDPDGTGHFLSTNQAYYEYAGAMLGADGMLSQNETSSAKQWQFTLTGSVTEFRFSVYVATEVQFPRGYIDVTPQQDSVVEGESTVLGTIIRTAVGDPVAVPPGSVTWSSSDPSIATVDANGSVAAIAPGTVQVTATAGLRSGSATIAVCPSIAVGETRTLAAGATGVCLPAGAYTFIASNTHAAASLPFSFTGAGIIGVSGSPDPGPSVALGSGGLQRRGPRPLSDVLPAIASPPAAARGRPVTPGVPAVGALMSINSEFAQQCSAASIRTGRVIAVGTNVIVLADTLNPSGGLSAAEYQGIADAFDISIHPTVAGLFGVPSDIDSNGRVVLFFTSAVNALGAPVGAHGYGIGMPRDLAPAFACPTSNVGELLYVRAADPAGSAGPAVSGAELQFVLPRVLTHMYAHLVNGSRRIYVNSASGPEESWLDEALARVAEEELYFAVGSLAAGSNINVATILSLPSRSNGFLQIMEPNFADYRQFLLDPDAQSPLQSDGDAATTAAAWVFLRYLSDMSGDPDFIGDVANSQTSGLTNLDAVLGGSGLALAHLRNWHTAVYADDAGGSVDVEHTLPSWNFRNIFAVPTFGGSYALAVRNPGNGISDVTSLAPGSAQYLRAGVPAGGFAGFSFSSSGAPLPATGRITIYRRQ